jgi:hypothetical protein
VRFDGSTWTPLGDLELDGRSLAKYDGTVYVAGQRMSLSAPRSGGVYRWSNGRWELVGLADADNDFPRVSALVLFRGRLIAGGLFTSIGGVPARGIAAWNGSAWEAMDAGLVDSDVYALCECGGTLYAGGFVSGAGVVMWDGSRWVPLAAPDMRVQPYCLACDRGRVYAGGFVSSPTEGERGLARWDGSRWSLLGSGVNDAVRALLVHDDVLDVGGRFTIAGGHNSSGIARWDLGSERAEAQLASGAGWPNPFTVDTRIAYALTVRGRVRVDVYDVRGRRTASLEVGDQNEGAHSVSWNGRGDDGRVVPPGVYFVRVSLPGRVEQRRVVRLK